MRPSVLALLAATASALPSNHIRQTTDTTSQERADAVVEAFRHAWTNYYAMAFPNDEIEPLTGKPSNPRNGWGASAIDALSTACVMRQKDIVNQIIEYVPKIDYSVSKDDAQVSLFETTIRYLGGMLSGYDFLSGPLANLVDDKANVQALLTQSEQLANVLSFAFDTPSGVPANNLYLGNRSTDGSTTNGLATIGTLILEWQHLSDLTGNSTYGQLAQRGEDHLLNPQPASNVPWPGLVGTNVDINTGEFTDASGGWVGGDDSYYEYLIKMYVYDSERYANYKTAWTTAADSSIDHLASHPSSRPDLTYLAIFNGQNLGLVSQHLACFDGGNFILAGLTLNEQKYIDFGLQLTDSCYNTYNSTASKIGPETFRWDEAGVPADQADFYAAHGFYIDDAVYDLRPEVLESYYYAWRATKDTKYRDWAWEGFVAINQTTRTDLGFSAVSNVNDPTGGDKLNDQESFLFAEVLKYAYLIFADDDEWQVEQGGVNEWVFNTEAHPFRVRGTPV